MPTKSKKRDDSIDYSFDHCVQRMAERYDSYELTRKTYDLFNEQVIKFHENNKTITSINITRISKDKTTMTYLLEDKYYCVFDPAKNRITTFLPPETIKNKK